MYQAPTETLTIGGVLDDGLRIYRETFSRVWLYALLAGVVSLPLTYAANQLDQDAATPGAIGAFLLLLLVMYLAVLSFYAMLITRMHSIVAGQPLGFGAAAGHGLRRAPSYIAGAILYGLMLSVAVFVTGLIVVAVGGVMVGVFGLGSDSSLAAVLAGIFTVLLAMLPAAYLSITFFFYNYAAVLDNKGPGSALAYSARLLSGNWLRTAAVLTIAFFIIGVAYLIVLTITGAVDLTEAGGIATPGWLGALLDYVIAPIIQALVVPLFYALPLAVYNDLKLRREGSDLAARIAAVES